MGKGLKILLTFKETERYLYDEIQNHSGKSAWVKDILKQHVEAPPDQEQQEAQKVGR